MENLFVVVQHCIYGPEDGYRDEIHEIENIYGPYSEEEAREICQKLNKDDSYEYVVIGLRKA